MLTRLFKEDVSAAASSEGLVNQYSSGAVTVLCGVRNNLQMTVELIEKFTPRF